MKVLESIRLDEELELDLRAYELRRTGQPVKLERIPMEVLLLLIEQRGRLVTREQIVEKIWGKDAFLDTDNSINGAIRKIRCVLKDDPEEPRFIQTLTGRGYRFIAQVVETTAEEAPPVEVQARSIEEPVAADLVSQPAYPNQARRYWPFYVCAVALAVLGLGAWFRLSHPVMRPAATSGRLMLAVLPFEDLTGDTGQDYFSEGLTEEMITQLGGLDPEHMGVIARTSVMAYKNDPKPLNQIGRELGVQYVLEGSIRRDAKRVRITAQLVKVKDQSPVWAQVYERDLEDVLVIEGDIAQEIALETGKVLGSRRAAPAGVSSTMSRERYEAHDLYLRGLYFFNRRTIEGFQQAIQLFQEATEKDPKFARAYAGLADSYALLGAYSGYAPSEYASRARAAALRAVELDDSSSEAHTALALIVQNYDYDWQTSEKEFKRAIALNPNYATAHHWYAEHMMWQGRFDEALAENDRARQLDPLSLIIAVDKGAILMSARQYDRAIEQLSAVSEMDPTFLHPRIIESAYIKKRMFEKVRADIDSWPPAENSAWNWAGLAFLNGGVGRGKEARHALSKLLELSRRQPLDPMVFVTAYIGVKDNDAAIAAIEAAYLQHSNNLTSLKVNPDFDALRSDPRFEDLERRVGLE